MIQNRLTSNYIFIFKIMFKIFRKIFWYPINDRIEYSDKLNRNYLKATSIYLIFILIFNIAVLTATFDSITIDNKVVAFDIKSISLLSLIINLPHLFLPFIKQSSEIRSIIINLEYLNTKLNCLINRVPLIFVVRLVIFVYIYFIVPLLFCAYHYKSHYLYYISYVFYIIFYYEQYVNFEILNIVIDTINVYLEVLFCLFERVIYFQGSIEILNYFSDVNRVVASVCQNLGSYVLIFILGYGLFILLQMYMCYIYLWNSIRDYIFIISICTSAFGLFIISWSIFSSHKVSHEVSMRIIYFNYKFD